jgi:hypothetical protein
MPNEPVQCPNCGSGDVHQVAADSYQCEHCHTSFHWVNPTKTTVVQKPSLCECGRVAVVFCCRCGRGLCQMHEDDRRPVESISEMELEFEVDRVGWWSSSQYMEFRKRHRIPEDGEAIICTSCVVECCRAIEAHEEELLPAAAQGQLCGQCFSDHVQGRCIICGVGVCSEHRVVCERCRQFVCYQHVVNGRLCANCGTPPQPPPIIPPTNRTSRGSPLLGRLWDRLRGFGK